ncbi:MAG: hypothetical protein KF898_07445 [Parachlamydiales bacterium]|nr:hypothetical protein [Candidatus Acheromyda pituitae]
MSNRLLPFLSSCSLILIIGVNADNVNASTNSEGQKPKDNSIEITPPGRPQVKHGANLFITADYLLWKATEQNLNYAVDLNNSETVGSNEPKGKVFNVKFNCQSGFRVGLGYNLGHDQWDTTLEWTWFRDHGSGSASSSNHHIFSTIGSPSFTGVLGAAKGKSHLDLHLNLLDWELGREFYTGKHLTVRPFGGLRTGWVDQNWNTSYFDPGSFGQVPLRKFQVHLKQDFWGIGLRGGLDTEWHLISGLSIYGNGALSLLYGFYKDVRLEKSVSKTGIKSRHLFVDNSKRCEQAITELQLGLRWDQMFSHDRFHFRIQTGWEHLMFFDHNHLFYFTESGAPTLSEYGGNLTFQGWTTSARFDF